MSCPQCGSSNLLTASHCSVCGYALVDAVTGAVVSGDLPTGAHIATDAPIANGAPIATTNVTFVQGEATRSADPAPRGLPSAFTPGGNIAGRYHIVRLLGVGGMGAVFQAWDEKLGVAVAMKVILQPDASGDPQKTEALERRFKRELLLARQVTDKNVVRIHDLGEVDGVLYITMPYVQGKTSP